MFNNLNKKKKLYEERKLLKKFESNPAQYISEFEEYMLQVCKEKLNIDSNNVTKCRIVMAVKARYPKLKGACEILYDHFSGREELPLEDNAKFLIEAISQIKNV